MSLYDEIVKTSPQVTEVMNAVKAPVIETTHVVVKDNKEKTETEVKNTQTVRENKFFTEKPTYLNVKFSSNINLGNYQSAKVEKGLLIPVGAELDPKLVDKVKACDEWASKLLEQLIEKEVQPILQAINKKASSF